MLQMPPQQLVRFLKDHNISRFHIVNDAASGRMYASHPALQPLADFMIGDRRDFRGHEGAFFQVSSRHDTLQGAFVHGTGSGLQSE